jgi:hypothetical protein
MLDIAVGAVGGVISACLLYPQARRIVLSRLRAIIRGRPCPVLWIRNRVDLMRFMKRRAADTLRAYIVLDMEAIRDDMESELTDEELVGEVGERLTGDPEC